MADNVWEGSAAVRRLARERGADHLAADSVDLVAATHFWENTIDLLSAAAVYLGGAVGWALVPDNAGYHALALAAERIAALGTDLDLACAVFDATAYLLHPLTDLENRCRTMREMAVGYFRHHRVPTVYVGEPQLLMGHLGLYEVRVEFDVDRAVSRTSYGMSGDAFTMRP
ncbi:hypothetical protein [Nocardia sputi]|uniref:hypothetical protein n=1 Tax=Nocardia sputi TaxID=2943705 RepID=UPI0020BF77BC|nr:hypothetical protein [Nocardia sputi]